MSKTWIIAKRELASFFDSLIAYILLIAFLVLTGLFTWLLLGDVFYRKQADMLVFFYFANFVLCLFIPAITMRLLSEEQNSGTLELLLTKDVTDRQIVLGKFLAGLLMVCIAFAFTLIYYITISGLGNFDHGAAITGYLGLILMSSAFVAIGLFASSITKNQIVAFLLALVIVITFRFLFDLLAQNSHGWLSELFNTLSIQKHYESIARGVIDTKDVIYFLSLTALGIFLSEYMISKRG